MSYIDEILNSYNISFVDDFDKWSSLVEDVNNYIPKYLSSISLSKHKVEPYSYNNFCSSYKKEIELYIRSNKNIDVDIVYQILDILIKKKIVVSFGITTDTWEDLDDTIDDV
jgi:hypothetical protein